MSTVTNYVLKTGPAGEDAAVAQLGSAVGGAFLRVDGEVYNREHPEGKALEVGIYIWAANYVAPEELSQAMQSVQWEEADDVQLFAQEQEASAMTEVSWRVPLKECERCLTRKRLELFRDGRAACIGCEGIGTDS